MVRWKSRVVAAATVAVGAAAAWVATGNAWAIYGGSDATEPYPFMASVRFKTASGRQGEHQQPRRGAADLVMQPRRGEGA